MKSIVFIGLVLLSGCSVNSHKWSDAEELCKYFGGVESVLSKYKNK